MAHSYMHIKNWKICYSSLICDFDMKGMVSATDRVPQKGVLKNLVKFIGEHLCNSIHGKILYQ